MTDADWKERFTALNERMRRNLADPAYQAKVAAMEAEAARDSENQRVWTRRYRGIPRSFDLPLDQPRPTPALAAVQGFVTSEKQILLLAGEVGLGKSVAAAAGVEMAMGRFVSAIEIAQANLYDGSMRKFFSPPLLAVDEVGVEPLDQGGWAEAKLYDVINGRLQANKKTILVTNLPPADFLSRYPDKRLKDRLRAHADVALLKGASMRGRDPTAH